MKKPFLNIVTAICLSFSLISITPTPMDAQCPMCRMSAENNLKDGGTAGKGLNRGILFMLAAPYFIVGGLGFVWWRNRKEEDELLEQ